MRGTISRLMQELKQCSGKSSEFWEGKEDVILCPMDDSSLFCWLAYIKGPLETPFEGGVFRIKISIPDNYPVAPPKMFFLTPIIHPNIHLKTGQVCLDILKTQWTPIWTLESACRAVMAMLADPEADSPLNCDAGNLIRNGDFIGYSSVAQMFTKDYAYNHQEMRRSWPGAE